MSEFSIIRGDQVLCRGTYPESFYPPRVIRQMQEQGLKIVVDGKTVKRYKTSKSQKSENEEAIT